MATRRRLRGQTLVEFALVLPVFFVMLFGLLDMGRFVYMNSTLSQAAREAARLGAVEAFWIGRTDANCNQPGGPVCPADVAAFRADVLAAANRMVAPFGSITNANLFTSCDAPAAGDPTGSWTSTDCAVNDIGAHVSVRVVLEFNPITPVVGQMYSSISTSGAATMVIN
jgi:TadE-like protein